jgi:hypothetical protein
MILLRSMDDTTIIPDLYEIGRIVARQQVKEEHWSGDLAQWCDGSRPAAARRELPASPPGPSETSLRYRAMKRLTETLSHGRARLVRLTTRQLPD